MTDDDDDRPHAAQLIQPVKLIRGGDKIAERLGVSSDTVTRMVWDAELPAFVLRGSLAISEETLRNWTQMQEGRSLLEALEAKQRRLDKLAELDAGKAA
jgi:excisionase family DNA binding protein